MKKIWKKNQVIITALAIMIAVAGYLNFTGDKQVLKTSVENLENEGTGAESDDADISAVLEDTIVPSDYAEVSEDGSALETMDTIDTDNTGEEINNEESTGEELASASLDENGDPIDSDTVGEAVLTSGSVTLSQAKLNREQTRSKAKEMLLEIINNENLSEDAKKDASKNKRLCA